MKQIEVKQYVCEYCHRHFRTENECTKCEETHKKNPTFTELRYESYKEDPVGFPHTMAITFDDGSKAVYKYAKQLDKIEKEK